MTQKALIVRTGADGHDGLKELNVELERGWRVVQMTPMGGAGGAAEAPSHAALVILEHRDERSGPMLAVEALEQVERAEEYAGEHAKSTIEKVVNGNEPTPDLSSS